MNVLPRFRHLTALFILLIVIPAGRAALPTVPDERDRQVLESLLLHLLTDTNFDVTKVPTNGASIILHFRTPEKTGFLMPEQIRSDIDGKTLPGDAEENMRRRNSPIDAKPGMYDSVAATYTNLAFAPGIIVTNLTETWNRPFSFGKDYPKARGWLDAYLPGYSEDGTRAVVRAAVGPWAHAAMLTAVLEKSGEKWTVKWYLVARFA